MLKGQLFYSGSIPGSVTRCLKVLLNTFVQLHTYKMTKVDTEFSKVGSKFCQILIKPSKSCQIFIEFRQSGYGRKLVFQRLWIRIPAPYI